MAHTEFPPVASPLNRAIFEKSTPSTVETLDARIQVVRQRKDEWARQSIANRLAYLETMIRDFAALAPQWVQVVTAAQRNAENDHAVGTEWISGPYAVLRGLQCLKRALSDIQSGGLPKIPGPVTVRPNGQVCARVFPQTTYDRLMFSGYRAEVWMQPGVSLEALHQTQALAYRDPDPAGKLALVLGAGNQASIAVSDALDKLFVQNQVVLLKLNPVNDYMAPLIEQGFRCLIEAGYLRIVCGGASEGAYLCRHPDVDEVFITGSNKTFDAIVFGPGEAGARRKAERKPLLDKPVAGELGNVTPVIVVPGGWSPEDLDYQAENLASWLTINASYTCNTPRVIIVHAQWAQRAAFLDALRKVYQHIPLRFAFYPGSQQRYQSFVDAHPGAQRSGEPKEGELPWTIIPEVNIQNRDDICFTTEAFCSVAAVAPVSAASIPAYLERAVAFANETLWGTLAAGLIVHPASMKDLQIKAAVDKAIEELRYGTIGVNCPAGISWVMTTTPWGAYAGGDIFDIQSGNSFVHNSLMFSRPQKTVVYAKFREMPKPIAFASRGKTIRSLGPQLVDLMATLSPSKLPRMLWTALR